ncbi:MAG TPA: ATP-binding cassette domain-containing protein [Solirubrobacterales bacterium]|jgi:ABC-2 type transport system ATP-binding protein
MIEVDGLTKEYRHFTAVKQLSFVAKPGQVTGFLGPNGAGKTTTISMILGLAEPSGGRALVAGKPFRELADPPIAVGAVLAGGAFHDGRSARASLLATCAAAGLPASRVDEVLELTGIADVPDRRVGKFSLGMRQRLSLAQALLGDPQVLILDEPANGLDPEGIIWLRQSLRSLAHEQGKTVFVSSHILSEMQETVDSVVVIAEGQLISEFGVTELTGEASVLARAGDQAALAAAVEAAGAKVARAGEELRITGLDSVAVGEVALKAGVALSELKVAEQDLESRYMELTAGKGR